MCGERLRTAGPREVRRDRRRWRTIDDLKRLIETSTGALVLAAFHLQSRVKLVNWLESQRHTRSPVSFSGRILVSVHIVNPAIHPVVREGCTGRELIGDGTTHGALDRKLAIVSIESACRGVKCVAGLSADDIQGSGDRIVAEEGTLWPLQDFDPLEIEKTCGTDSRPTMIDVVDEGSDRLVEGLVLTGANAAYIHFMARAGGCDMQTRHGHGQSLE